MEERGWCHGGREAGRAGQVVGWALLAAWACVWNAGKAGGQPPRAFVISIHDFWRLWLLPQSTDDNDIILCDGDCRRSAQKGGDGVASTKEEGLRVQGKSASHLQGIPPEVR